MPTLDYKPKTALETALAKQMPPPKKSPGEALLEQDAKKIMDKLKKMFDEA